MIEIHEQRQLLAIMFTDVVGYTKLTERDEAAAVRLRQRHRDLVRSLAKQFDGELVDATGDESLSIFPSALRAVDCAIALQDTLRSHPELRLRIGIHLGDVLRRGGEVIGEGVNVAARIRPLAEPGGICISEQVFQLVRNRPHVHARALGAQALKNVTLPVAVYTLSEGEAGEAAPPRRPRRVRLVAAVGVAILATGLAFANRVAVGTWLALNLPRVLARPLEQQIGFATTSDGVRIAYATTGQGSPLVQVLGWMTHLKEGLGSPLYDAAGIVRWYSRDHLLVRFDGRGFGLSDRNVSDFGLDARVRDLEAVVDALGFERFALYAMSAGGPTALAYAARHPERVTHLVLAATSTGFGHQFLDSSPWRGVSDLARTGWDSPPARAAIAELLAPSASEIERHVLMHLMLVSANGGAVAGFMDAGGTIDASEQARLIRVPTLVIAGSEDRAVRLEDSRALAAAIPGARFEILEGAGHIQASVLDARLLHMVSAFLADEPAPTG